MKKTAKQTKPKMPDLIKRGMIAPCGMNCALCSSYLAWREDLKAEGINRSYCEGCRPQDRKCAFLKKRCPKLLKGQVKYCFECKEYPCERLKRLDKRYRTYYHMSMLANLDFIKKKGIRRFLKKEQRKWRCPKCGARSI